MSQSLAGSLLIASPGLADTFRRTVVLIVEHNDQGAFGLVLNRPSETTLEEAIPELAELVGGDHVVHVGGPVQPNAVTAYGRHLDTDLATKPIVADVGMVDLEDPPELAEIRVFAGYAGWSAGQLDAEVEAQAWYLESPHPDDLFEEGDLWARILGRKGGEFSLLARMPADPSVN